jgi:hypothetical protein
LLPLLLLLVAGLVSRRRLPLLSSLRRFPVCQRIFHVGNDTQSLVVLRYGLVVTARFGQGVTTVVSGISTRQSAPCTLRAREIALAIRLASLLQARMPDLVGTPPEAARSLSRLGGVQRLPWQPRAHQQRGEHATAPECEQGEQHQRQQQPVAVVLPDTGFLAARGCGTSRCGIEHAKRGDIAHARCHRGVPAVAGTRQHTQRSFVEARARDRTIAFLVGGTLRAAHAQR